MALMLKKLREAAGMTQRELADAINGSYRAIQSWESGRTYPDADKLWALAEVLHTNPNELLDWQNEVKSNSEFEFLTADEAEIIRCYRASTPQWRQNISMTARAAAGESKETAERDLSSDMQINEHTA